MIPQQPQTQTAQIQSLPPSREKLIKLLDGKDEEMILLVQKLIAQHKLPFIVEDGVLKDTLSPGEIYLNQFITVDPDTIKMKEYARLMAKTNHAVLILGATGTGKELIGKSMIDSRKGALKASNCAGFPRELIESELFGHVKGAFTGAISEKIGLFQAAKDGVMFLDEVGELPMDIQAKLLRVLQDKKIRKVGGNVDEDINCKFVFATHRDIKQMVDAGTFRKDLYARISTLELDIKPLHDRMCDCVPIAKSMQGGMKFLEHYEKDLVEGRLDLSLNVRSIEQHIIRFLVLGKVITK